MHRFARLAALALSAGCSSGPATPDGAALDLGVVLDQAMGETIAPVFAEITFTGCAKLDFAGDVPRCTGPAPLTAQLLPIAPPGFDSRLWTIGGGDPATSHGASPEVRWHDPGSYTVTLVVGGPSGMASATGAVEVVPAALAASCDADRQCATGTCLCDDAPDGGIPDGGSSGCPGALAAGLCTRACGGACGPGEVCADFSRSAARDPETGALPWRHPICIPSCASDGDCRPGLACIEVPALAAGGSAGGDFTWRRGCFADVLSSIGGGCDDENGKLAPTRCIAGECAPVGARGLCTFGCDKASCPPEAVCATFADDPMHPLCIARCDMAHPCADPLIACQAPSGFTVPQGEPMGATYCAPKRCAGPMDCAPAGSCDGPDGGASCKPL